MNRDKLKKVFTALIEEAKELTRKELEEYMKLQHFNPQTLTGQQNEIVEKFKWERFSINFDKLFNNYKEGG